MPLRGGSSIECQMQVQGIFKVLDLVCWRQSMGGPCREQGSSLQCHAGSHAMISWRLRSDSVNPKPMLDLTMAGNAGVNAHDLHV